MKVCTVVQERKFPQYNKEQMGANYYFEGTKLPTVQVSIPSIFGGSRTCFFGHALQVTNSIVWAVETPKKM